MRTTLPSFAGFNPRSDARMAFSIAPMTCRIERLRDDQRRLRHRKGGHLVDRHACAVRLDLNAVEQADRGTPGTDVCQSRRTCSMLASIRLTSRR